MKTTVILGAGFSRAISVSMPMTDELGNLILERMKLQRSAFSGGYFEMWLSRLAEPQPDLRDDRNYLNRARFQQVTDMLSVVMSERQFDALQSSPPLVAPPISRYSSRRTDNSRVIQL